jgi:hypothetical protein
MSEFDNQVAIMVSKHLAQMRVFACVCAASARVHTTLLCYYLSSVSHTSARSSFNRAEEAQSPSPSESRWVMHTNESLITLFCLDLTWEY